MKRMKFMIGFVLLFMLIGIAAVTTNVIVNMSTPIASNPDDFLVYFSDVKVNGTQDLSLVRNEKQLVFAGEFTAVGDKKVISYDVTNASKNYDAAIAINCSESTNYLTVDNDFDTSNLAARSTRTGTLTVELSTAVSEEITQDISCTIEASAVERTTKEETNTNSPLVRTFNVGDVLAIGNERFNIISTTDDTVTMFALYNLGTNYKQTEEYNYLSFSDNNGWEYGPGPNQVDIQAFDGNVKTYVNEYVSFLQGETGDTSLSGDLISLAQLGDLQCTFPNDYSENYAGVTSVTCAESDYSNWLVTSQKVWTKSATPSYADRLWRISADGSLYLYFYGNTAGVRPVITMKKEYFMNDNINFTLDGKTYSVARGTTWKQWLTSADNDTDLEYDDWDDSIYNFSMNLGHAPELLYNPSNLEISVYDACYEYNSGFVTSVKGSYAIIPNGIYSVGVTTCLGGGSWAE